MGFFLVTQARLENNNKWISIRVITTATTTKLYRVVFASIVNKGTFNDYVDKKEEVVNNAFFVQVEVGVVKKKGQNCVHVVIECP